TSHELARLQKLKADMQDDHSRHEQRHRDASNRAEQAIVAGENPAEHEAAAAESDAAMQAVRRRLPVIDAAIKKHAGDHESQRQATKKLTAAKLRAEAKAKLDSLQRQVVGVLVDCLPAIFAARAVLSRLEHPSYQ